MPATLPKVSVVIPVYNVEPYLRQCLDSVVGQTLKDIEIIIVNDGSPDGCPDIIREYAARDNRIVVIDKPNTGYGHSMNIGFDRARGEYLGIIEPDDYVHSTMYERLYCSVKKYGAPDIVKCSNQAFYTDSEKNSSSIITFPDQYLGTPIVPRLMPRVFLFDHSVWTCIYRQEFIRENRIAFLETPGASFQDNSFSFKAFALADHVVYIADVLLFHRRDNPTSSINNMDTKWRYRIQEWMEIERFLEKRPALWEKLKRVFYLKRHTMFIGHRNRMYQANNVAEYMTELPRIYEKDLNNNNVDFTYFSDFEKEQFEFIASLRNDDGVLTSDYHKIRDFDRGLEYDARMFKIALFGAGRAGRSALKYIRWKGFEVACFIDNKAAMQGKSIEGVPVVSLDSLLPSCRNHAIYIAVEDFFAKVDIIAQLDENNVKWKSMLPSFFLDLLGDFRSGPAC